MCGIGGAVDLDRQRLPDIEQHLSAMSRLLMHRGPDGAGQWVSARRDVGLTHRRLSIIDLTDDASQPMSSERGATIIFNGEIYNYKELRAALEPSWRFRSQSDTETIIAAYAKYGPNCVSHLRGMFAFALWDDAQGMLFCARDRFGIKPFYYILVGRRFYFASEMKALLPFLETVETDSAAFAEYITFQYTLSEQTLFKGIHSLAPGHALIIADGRLRVYQYWDVNYTIDLDHNPNYFRRHFVELMDETLNLHVRSDVPIGCYLSGGMDSSLMLTLTAQRVPAPPAFHGKFADMPAYDESHYARCVTKKTRSTLFEIDIRPNDFVRHINDVIYHLDTPIAGPGAFPQFMVSKLAAGQVKVVLGGQGGDEIFGGYARYLIAYFEQCIKAAIEGTYRNGDFVVTPESIIPNLTVLQEYKPLLKTFWQEGLFGPLDERYLRLIDRSVDMSEEIDWKSLDRTRVIEKFKDVFKGAGNVGPNAYFDLMTHFDLKCLLPALLHVEDRVSMAHGLEARVPFLDHRLVEFLATVPASVKFQSGRMKNLLKVTLGDLLPHEVAQRRDKMGFPVPLKEWFQSDLHEWLNDTFRSQRVKDRPHIDAAQVVKGLSRCGQYSRKLWGLLSIELWYQNFHDQASAYRAMKAA